MIRGSIKLLILILAIQIALVSTSPAQSDSAEAHATPPSAPNLGAPEQNSDPKLSCVELKKRLPRELRNLVGAAASKLDLKQSTGSCGFEAANHHNGKAFYFTQPTREVSKRKCSHADQQRNRKNLLYIQDDTKLSQIETDTGNLGCPEAQEFVDKRIALDRERVSAKLQKKEVLSREDLAYLNLYSLKEEKVSGAWSCFKSPANAVQACALLQATVRILTSSRGLSTELVQDGVQFEIAQANQTITEKAALAALLSPDEIASTKQMAINNAHNNYFGSKIVQKGPSADEIAKTAPSDWKPVPNVSANQFDTLGGAEKGYRVQDGQLYQYKFMSGDKLHPNLNKKMNGVAAEYVDDMVKAGRTRNTSNLGPVAHDRWAYHTRWEFGESGSLKEMVGKGISKDAVDQLNNGNPEKLYSEVERLVGNGKPSSMSQDTYIRLKENWVRFERLPLESQLKDLRQYSNLSIP